MGIVSRRRFRAAAEGRMATAGKALVPCVWGCLVRGLCTTASAAIVGTMRLLVFPEPCAHSMAPDVPQRHLPQRPCTQS